MGEILASFVKDVDFDVERNVNGIILSSLLRYLLSNPSVFKTAYVDLKNMDAKGDGLFEIGDFRMQIRRERNEYGEFSHYKMIIADNKLDENGKKRMTVLTAKSVKSELIEMDCSGMRENVIIDLNREGRRWEGCELNGKPFGFGFEYSEEDNLVYEGFVFEGKKVCIGKEWNDDGNNNCLVYEGCYCNGERCGKGKLRTKEGDEYVGEFENGRFLESILTRENEVVMNEILASFFNTVDFDVERNVNGIVLCSLLHCILSCPSVSKTGFVDLNNEDVNGDGLFAIGDIHIQINEK